MQSIESGHRLTHRYDFARLNAFASCCVAFGSVAYALPEAAQPGFGLLSKAVNRLLTQWIESH
jgi:hypothetical protein